MHLRALALLAAGLGLAATPASAKSCSTTEEERQAASKLDWQTFDQRGGVPGSFRDLANQGCLSEAVEAYRAWLKVQGDFPDQRARGIGLFHIGQALALSGNVEGAVAMIAKSYRDVEQEGAAARDWNTYVDGVLGFFAGDGQRIRDARKKLWSSDRAFARRQVGVLDGLNRCLGKSYAEAMSRRCRK